MLSRGGALALVVLCALTTQCAYAQTCTGTLFDDVAGVVSLEAKRALKAGQAVRLVQLRDGTAGVDAVAPNVADTATFPLVGSATVTSQYANSGVFDSASGPGGRYAMALYSRSQYVNAYLMAYFWSDGDGPEPSENQIQYEVTAQGPEETRAHWAVIDNSGNYVHAQMEPTLSELTPFAFALGITFDVEGYVYVLTAESRSEGYAWEYQDPSNFPNVWAFTDFVTLRMYSPTYELVSELTCAGTPTLLKDLSNLNSAATITGSSMETSGDRIFFAGQISGVWSFGQNDVASSASQSRARSLSPIMAQARILPGHSGLEWVSVSTVEQDDLKSQFFSDSGYYSRFNGTSADRVRPSPAATANVVYTIGEVEHNTTATFRPGNLQYDVAPRRASKYIASRAYLSAIDTTSGETLWARITTGDTVADDFNDVEVDDEGIVHVVGSTNIARDNASTFTLGGVSLSEEALTRAYALPQTELVLSLHIRVSPGGVVLSIDTDIDTVRFRSVSRTVDPDVLFIEKATRGFLFVPSKDVPPLGAPYPSPTDRRPYGFSVGNTVADDFSFGPLIDSGVALPGPRKYSDYFQSFGDGVKTADMRYLLITDCTLWCRFCTPNNRDMAALALEYGGPPDSTGKRGFVFGCVPTSDETGNPLFGDVTAQAEAVARYSNSSGLGQVPYTFCGWDETWYQQNFVPGHGVPLVTAIDMRTAQIITFQQGWSTSGLRAIVEALDAEDFSGFSQPSYLGTSYVSKRGAELTDADYTRNIVDNLENRQRSYETAQGYSLSVETNQLSDPGLTIRRSQASALKLPFVGVVRTGAAAAGEFACVDFTGNVVRDMPQNLTAGSMYWHGTTVQNNETMLSSVRYSHEAFAGAAIGEHTFIASAAA